MEVIVLQSGSCGNCFFVAGGGTQILIDAGISGRQAELRLAAHGYDIRDCAGLLISHDHCDHTKSLGIFHRKFGLSVHVTERTLQKVQTWCAVGPLPGEVHHFTAGDCWTIGGLSITAIPTPHDGVEAVAFVISDGLHRVGILTDLGHEFDGLRDVLRSLDAVVIESNYDDEMLNNGPYGPSLKRRIRGPGGHLSNREAAELLRDSASRLQWACLCHLSGENNCPQLAMQTSRDALGDAFPLYVAHRDRATEILRLC